MNKPTIGRIVMYNTTDEDRQYFSDLYGNMSRQLPAMIVAVWSDACVNLKVLCDTHCHDLWKTSIDLRDEHNVEGRWEWPQINTPNGRPSGGGGHSAN